MQKAAQQRVAADVAPLRSATRLNPIVSQRDETAGQFKEKNIC